MATRQKSNNLPSGNVNFQRIAAASLVLIPIILQRWLPGGQRQGNEYVVRNPRRHDRRSGSFKINIQTGAWGDFATSACGGDIISLAAYLFDMSQRKAAIEVAKMVGLAHDQ